MNANVSNQRFIENALIDHLTAVFYPNDNIARFTLLYNINGFPHKRGYYEIFKLWKYLLISFFKKLNVIDHITL